MNQLPKDVIVNIIIPKIVEDKNAEIQELKSVLKDIIHKNCHNFVCNCGNIVILNNGILDEIDKIKDVQFDKNRANRANRANRKYKVCDCFGSARECYECYECSESSESIWGLPNAQICDYCECTITTYKARMIIKL